MAAGNRRALVIGNNEYQGSMRLINASNDAHGVKHSMKALDFHVNYNTNLNHSEMEEVAEGFVNAIQQGDMVFFYFAGHGLQYHDTNYLVGIDAGIITRDRLHDCCFNAQNLLNKIIQRLPRTIIFILDCCRVNPAVEYISQEYHHGRSFGFEKGLAEMEFNVPVHRNAHRQPVMRRVVAFSCAPGQTADDAGDYEGYGAFAYHFIAQMGRRTDLIKILGGVQQAVARMSNNRQIPYIDDSGNEPVYVANTEKDGYESV